MRSTLNNCSTAVLLAVVSSLAGCQQAATAPPPTLPPIPATCSPTATQLVPQTIPCGEHVGPCGKIPQVFCPAQAYLHSTLPRPDGKSADYRVYWGATSKVQVGPDPQFPGFCDIQVDPPLTGIGYGLVTGQAGVIAGKRVRAASDGTVFAAEIDQNMKVERVIVLYVALPHEIIGSAPSQTALKLDAGSFQSEYMVFPLDPNKPSSLHKFNAGDPEAKAALEFLAAAKALACHMKPTAREFLASKFPGVMILPPD